MANAMIPLQATGFDAGGSIMKGVNIARALMGNGSEDELNQARTAYYLAQARKAENPAGVTPYQARSLANQERGLSLREQELAKGPRVGVVESIRGKLAKGEALLPGEQKVYDDAQRLSVFDKMLLGDGEQATSGTTAHPPLPSPMPNRQPMQFTPMSQNRPQPSMQTSPESSYSVGGNLPMISTAEEARRLPSGTKFRAPDGTVRQVP